MKGFTVNAQTRVLVDDSDWRKVGEHRWHISKHGSVIRTLEGGRVKQKMTDLIMNIASCSGQDVEFINGDTLDFRKDNLRIVDAPMRKERGEIANKPKLNYWQRQIYTQHDNTPTR